MSRPDWLNISVIASIHLVAIFAIVYMSAIQFSWWTVALGVLWFGCCGLGITGGYHRSFSHPAHRAHWPLRLFYLLFGAASVQNSALKWSSDHRRHHAFTDDEKDPYNIRRGFWWAHIGWVLTNGDKPNFSNVRDLEKDALIRWQHRFYVPIAVFMGVVVPFALGMLWGDPWGAVLVAGFLRLVIQWHATFAVNSVAHTFGEPAYNLANSARDSFLTVLITLGEGYHSFHHRFPLDYRNGHRWYHLDPTKWVIWVGSKIGLASQLRRTPAARVAQALREQSEPSPKRKAG